MRGVLHIIFGGEVLLIAVLAAIAVAAVVYGLAKPRAPVACPPNPDALRRVLETVLDDVYVDRIGNIMVVKTKALFFTYTMRIRCPQQTYQLSWPWPWALALLLLIPQLAPFAVVLLLWMLYKAHQLERAVAQAGRELATP